MNILLDTNIYLTDLTLSKPEYEALANYLSTSNSLLLLPSIVTAEIDKHIMAIAGSEASKVANFYSGRLGIIDKLPTKDEIGSALKEQFDKSLKNFKLANINYGKVTIEDLIERSLDETPPFKSKGRGFRDALIWHTLLAYLGDNPTASVALITKNSEDFGNKLLKPELLEELTARKFIKRVNYFNTLGDFLDKYGQPIAFIDDDLVEDAVRDLANSCGEENSDESELDDIDYPSREYQWHVSSVDYEEYRIENYYIYRTTKTHYHVSVEVTLIYYLRLDGYGMEWGYSHMDGDINWHPGTKEETAAGFKDIEILLTINKETKLVETIDLS